MCFNCSGSCSILNYPQTSFSQVNPIATIGNTTYTSAINQLASSTVFRCSEYYSILLSAQCTNCPYVASIPATSDASVLNNLQNGQFVGVFTCPIAMCLCQDKLNGTIDCYRGNSSAQIVLFAYNQNGNPLVSVINVCFGYFYVINRSLASYFNRSLHVQVALTRSRYSFQTAHIHRWLHQII